MVLDEKVPTAGAPRRDAAPVAIASTTDAEESATPGEGAPMEDEGTSAGE